MIFLRFVLLGGIYLMTKASIDTLIKCLTVKFLTAPKYDFVRYNIDSFASLLFFCSSFCSLNVGQMLGRLHIKVLILTIKFEISFRQLLILFTRLRKKLQFTVNDVFLARNEIYVYLKLKLCEFKTYKNDVVHNYICPKQMKLYSIRSLPCLILVRERGYYRREI